VRQPSRQIGNDLTIEGHGNTSNVFRLKSLIAEGRTIDLHNRYVNQTVQYFQAATDASQWSRMNNRSGGLVDQQIRHIVKGICQTLQGPQDEIFLYGSGRGAYTIQVVASLLHSLGRPKSMGDFDLLYQKALDLGKAFRSDDSLNGNKLMTYLKVNCNDPPKIQFLGAFDTLKTPVEKYPNEPSFVGSIQHFRHALAFNDAQKTAPHILETPENEELGERSFIQAWFMGNHRDVCGGSEHDGLSLFPLQWMLLESMRAGLLIQSNARNEVLSITFPQFAGGLPKLDADEKAQWRLKYTNGIEVSMFDLQSVHGDTKDGPDYSVRLSGRGLRSQRKVFNSDKTLVGWSAKHPYGNIIHPSVFTMLDRNSRYYDQGVFKSKKRELADFQERCLDDQDEPQPWLEGFALQASGVKAFRILVCGKTGVGKSTLINKVFGVEMTEESTSYAQGVHDINQAFESPNHPGLLIHDSRGWQAGSDSELDLIAKFLRHRAFQKNPAEALHVIWQVAY
jgi:hypothetical protein